MSTQRSIEATPDPNRRDPPPPERPDIVVVGEAEEAPVQQTFEDLPPEPGDPIAERIAPVLRALDRGVERTRKDSEAEARRIVAAARDEAARIRKGVEDELVAAHLGLEQLRARRDEVIQQLRDLYDLVVSTADQLGPAPEPDPRAVPRPPGAA